MQLILSQATAVVGQPRTRLLLVGVVALLALVPPLLRNLLTRSICSATTIGEFNPWGSIPGEPTNKRDAVYWSSWNGSDDCQGEFRSDAFEWSPSVSFRLRGYPNVPGNELYLERTSTGETLLYSGENPGELWIERRIAIPASWRGSTLRIVAKDHARGWGGWLAIGDINTESMPKPPLSEFIATLNMLFVTGVLELGLALGAHRIVGRLAPSVHLALPFAFCALGLVAYATWGCFLVGPAFGRCFVGFAMLILFVSAGRAVWCSASNELLQEWIAPLLIAIVASMLYLGILCLFQPGESLAQLAANRFLSNMPADNQIPQYYANILWSGANPRQAFGDWLSSDRPPLQVGWILLVGSPLSYLGYGLSKSGQVTSIWFQLLWIPASWAWLRSIGQSAARSTIIILAVIPSFWVAFNSIYAWPKLAATAFAIIAYSLWFTSNKPKLMSYTIGGLAAGLAWLCHGGIAFALLGLVPLAVCSLMRGHIRQWILATCAFLGMAFPWKIYQSVYDPPGNRLLKWHLAGVVAPDSRGTLETLKYSYATKNWAELVDTRVSNARLLFTGDWKRRFSPRTNYQDLRLLEATYFVFSLGHWPFALFAAIIMHAFVRKCVHPWNSMPEWRALAWVAWTLLAWVSLMFIPNSTQNHQGTYLSQLVFTLASASMLLKLNRKLFGLIAIVNLGYFILIAVPSESKTFPLRPDSLTLAILGSAVITLLVMGVSVWRHDQKLTPFGSKL